MRPAGRRRRGLLAAWLMLSLCTGCASVSTFSTDPAGAKLYVNGRYLGQTPVQFTSPRAFGHRYHVQVMKDGFAAQDFYIDSRMSWIMGYLAPFFPPLLFWAWSLDSDYSVHLPALDESSGAAAPAVVPDGPQDKDIQQLQIVR